MTRKPLIDFEFKMSSTSTKFLIKMTAPLDIYSSISINPFSKQSPAVTKIINESGHELNCEIHSNIFRGATVATLITES